MTIIKQADFIQSIADGFQFIACYHPLDYIDNLADAYQREASVAAKDAIAQILYNSRLCATGQRPICQDTGIATVFLRIGMKVRWDSELTVTEMVNEGVRRAYLNPQNPLRASILHDPAGKRQNSKDNTPAVVHVELVAGDGVDVRIAAKGGGSENKAKFVNLNPSDSLVDWVLETLPGLGAGWCPPGILGIGIGGTAEKAMLLAKESLLEPIDIQVLQARGAQNKVESLRLELYDKVNKLGIGAQGLGGLTTVLDVKILDYPTHAASLPVAMIPNCAATRHAHFNLDGSGAHQFSPPPLSAWPDLTWQAPPNARRVNLDTLTQAEMQTWQAGEPVLLSGHLLTGRDAAHKKLADLLANKQPLPQGLDFNGRFIYYVGPVDAVADEVVGPAGPTTATRMDKFSDMMLNKLGLLGMIGKAERGQATIDLLQQQQKVYLMAVGGAAYLVSQAIKTAKVIAFPELGMEAIYEFEVKDMPVTVAVDSTGLAVHQQGPKQWQRIDWV